jgi:hypothetical protein
MILNAYTVLDAFTTLLRLSAGLLVVWLGLSAWWRWRGTLPSERRTFLEDRTYLLFLLATLLLFLNLASWPLLYLLLQSYVPEWGGGVMCIYGVTQIGAGSIGPSRFLPGLLTALQLTKPLLVFVSGAWLVLYLLNRRTATAPLTPRVLLAIVLVGLVAVADATLEGAYLAIPKKEEFPSAGCCTPVFDNDSRSLQTFLVRMLGTDYVPWLWGAFYAINGSMALALAIYAFRPGWRQGPLRLAPLAVGALVSVPVSLAFLIEVAAPALLHLPEHHCPYDLIPDVPESMAAVALLALGSFAVGWACVAAWFGRSAETQPLLAERIGKLLRLALWGYLGWVLMLSVELALT